MIFKNDTSELVYKTKTDLANKLMVTRLVGDPGRDRLGV